MHKAASASWRQEHAVKQEARTERRRVICGWIDDNAFDIHFQPIYSLQDGRVFGYEALTRLQRPNVFGNIEELFQAAKETGIIGSLDMLCRENALREAAARGFRRRSGFLFVNICPQTLLYPSHTSGLTDEVAERYGIAKERIILEITEQEAIRNYKLFKQSVEHYRERGYKIAIDDFGAGYGGLKMLSIIEPDFLKIDRHFISDIDKSIVKYNLVEAIATACHRIGIRVIAEGIEQEVELRSVLCHGIDLVQGYYLSPPAAGLVDEQQALAALTPASRSCRSGSKAGDEAAIGDIVQEIPPLSPVEPVMAVFTRFIENPALRSLPVVEGDRVVGMLNRVRFLEQRMLGRFGYGFALSSYKTVCDVLEHQFLLVESGASLEEVARKIRAREDVFLYDDICVAERGRYRGTVAVSALLDAITQRSIRLAKGANPLTGLPGNEFIQRQIGKMLSQNIRFEVCYIDIDNFKPYNDCYGFEKGDAVIRALAEIIVAATAEMADDGSSFVGHIGGDDFIVITRPRLSEPLCERVISCFEGRRHDFHDQAALVSGTYRSVDRGGAARVFGLLSLSISIVGTGPQRAASFAEIASLASEVKKAAKQRPGSAIVRDRRERRAPEAGLEGACDWQLQAG